MKNNQIKIIIITIISISLVSTIIPSSSATQPCTVRGYVYLDGVIQEPDSLVLSFDSQDIDASLYNDGYFIFDFNEEVGETGMFHGMFNGQLLTAAETITIQYDVYAYKINLTFTSPPNHPPNKPTDPIPANNSENTSINLALSVLVTDPDEDSMDVSFYNGSDDSLIDTVNNVLNGTRAEIQLTQLDYNTTYSWYAVANDSEFETKSDVFTFTTRGNDTSPPVIKFVKPEPGSLYIFGYKIFSNIFRHPLIIGDITVELNVTDNESGVERVELFIEKFIPIDDVLFYDEPYVYNLTFFGIGKYWLKVTAYDHDNNHAQAQMMIRKFL